ncbi:DUF488 family protein [Thiofaba sp. EF100]|uniref:DUF488 domain-containing protein n=1 Tax=Thiofaba sp. EF100 TaxID=3121274 RepID=UPI003221E504
MNIQLKRIYVPKAPGDGLRILIDGLWPRGIAREAGAFDVWHKAIAPSRELRSWFGHDPARWTEFRRRYFDELDGKPEAVEALREEIAAAHGPVTFVFASRDTEHNHAVALRDYLEGRRRD